MSKVYGIKPANLDELLQLIFQECRWLTPNILSNVSKGFEVDFDVKLGGGHFEQYLRFSSHWFVVNLKIEMKTNYNFLDIKFKKNTEVIDREEAFQVMCHSTLLSLKKIWVTVVGEISGCAYQNWRPLIKLSFFDNKSIFELQGG